MIDFYRETNLLFPYISTAYELDYALLISYTGLVVEIEREKKNDKRSNDECDGQSFRETCEY